MSSKTYCVHVLLVVLVVVCQNVITVSAACNLIDWDGSMEEISIDGHTVTCQIEAFKICSGACASTIKYEPHTYDTDNPNAENPKKHCSFSPLNICVAIGDDYVQKARTNCHYYVNGVRTDATTLVANANPTFNEVKEATACECKDYVSHINDAGQSDEQTCSDKLVVG